MKTFGQLKTEILNQIYPSGTPENLVTPFANGTKSAYDMLFDEAAAEISKWVPCEQEDNINLIAFCKTNYKCGLTVIPAPAGVVVRVFTVAGLDYCDPVLLRQVKWPEPECWASRLFPPKNTAFSNLPMGFQPADASTDCQCGRARSGIWAIKDRNIYIAPWIQSNELIVVEWRGVKTEWSDTDLVNPAQDYKKALKAYVQYGHERDYGDFNKAQMYLTRVPGMMDRGLFADALADLIWQCDQQTKVRKTEECWNDRWGMCWPYFGILPAPTSNDTVPVPPPPVIYAQIGNWGEGCAGAVAVQQQITNMAPTAILSAGNQAPGPITASFTESGVSGQAPYVVNFTGTSTGVGLTYDWNFGDGSPHSVLQNPSHVFNAIGTFTVTLTITNCAGDTSMATVNITGTAGNPDLVPKMTSNTTPSGVVTSNASNTSSVAPWVIFDDTVAVDFVSTWQAYNSGAGGLIVWIQYQFPGAQTVRSYNVRVFDKNLAPTDWVFSGSNDGVTFTTIDSPSGQVWVDGETKNFMVASPGSYLYYRFLPTGIQDINGIWPRIDELEFFAA